MLTPFYRAKMPPPKRTGGGSVHEESSWNAGDRGSTPGSGGSPGRGHGNPLQYACLDNPMDRGAWRVIIHELGKELAIT